MGVVVAALSVAPGAQAEPVPEAQRMTLYPLISSFDGSNGATGATAILVAPEGSTPPEGATYDFTLFSCGRLVGRETTPQNADGRSLGLLMTLAPDTVGPTADFRVEVTQPGFDPYVLATTYDLAAAGRNTPSCENVAPADPNYDDVVPIVRVQKWSVKKGFTSAVIGRRLAVTRTRASGAKVSYAWRVGTKVVERDRAMTVKRRYKGKKITFRVTVTMVGAKTASRTLRYGTVMRGVLP